MCEPKATLRDDLAAATCRSAARCTRCRARIERMQAKIRAAARSPQGDALEQRTPTRRVSRT